MREIAIGTSPGAIISKGVAEDPSSPDVRIWRIRRDWQTADLTRDAAEFFHVAVDSLTEDQIEAVRSQYEKDWNQWPWQKGAPFYDTNGNGIKDEGEEPGLAHADQVVWFVANDLDSAQTQSVLGSPPIGLEMQVTLWAYNSTGSALSDAFQHIIFKRIQLIYKGRAGTPADARIDSMFIGKFVDTDIGDFADDYGGCDTLLQLGFGYNSSNDGEYRKFNLAPPSIGYAFIQGPVARSDEPSASARFNFGTRTGFVNLKMSSFWLHATGGTNSAPGGRDYESTVGLYNLLNGFYARTQQIPYQFPDGSTTKFMLTGDPVAGTGWIDGLWDQMQLFPHYGGVVPGDRYFSMNSGPFAMALGDTQEVIIAIVGGVGSDRLASVAVMKHYVKWAHCWAQAVFQSGLEGQLPVTTTAEGEELPQDFRLYQNYPNPFNSNTEIRYDLPLPKKVTLTIYNLRGQQVKVLVNEHQNSGYFTVLWDGTDSQGNKVPSGLYLYELKAGYWSLAKKMMLLR